MLLGSIQEPGREVVVTLAKSALGILAAVVVGQALIYLLIQKLV